MWTEARRQGFLPVIRGRDTERSSGGEQISIQPLHSPTPPNKFASHWAIYSSHTTHQGQAAADSAAADAAARVFWQCLLRNLLTPILAPLPDMPRIPGCIVTERCPTPGCIVTRRRPAPTCIVARNWPMPMSHAAAPKPACCAQHSALHGRMTRLQPHVGGSMPSGRGHDAGLMYASAPQMNDG